MENTLTVYGREIVKDGDRVWDRGTLGGVLHGTLKFQKGEWVIFYDDDPAGVYYTIINPSFTHKG